MTGAKNKMRLEKNNYCRAFRDQKARHPELEKRLCDYVNDKRQYRCAVSSEMCQLKALAITKVLKLYTASVSSSCRKAGADLASSGEWRGVATASIAQHPHTALASTCVRLTVASTFVQSDVFFQANLYFSCHSLCKINFL